MLQQKVSDEGTIVRLVDGKTDLQKVEPLQQKASDEGKIVRLVDGETDLQKVEPLQQAAHERAIVDGKTDLGKVEPVEAGTPATCGDRFKRWMKKYFWEGQELTKTQTRALEKLDDNAPLHKRILVRHRRVVAYLVPIFLAQFIWWSIMIDGNYFYVFKDKYYMSLTMILGATVAGMTSEGGGAVAFPVLTLVFSVNPSIARDVAFMVQATGMGCASATILFMRVQLEWYVLIFSTTGGIAGLLLGLYQIDPYLKPPEKKMIFVSTFFAFASVLFLINRYHKRRTFSTIPDFKLWKGCVLVLTGFVGGLFTSFAGSGVDICTFSVVTLLFRVSEKTATPTSVIMMAFVSAFAFYWRLLVGDVSTDAWEYLAVISCVATVVAPAGALLGSHFHRLVLATFVCVLDLVALIGAFAIVHLTPFLIGLSIGIIVVGLVIFALLTYAGQMLLRQYDQAETAAKGSSDQDGVKRADDSEHGDSDLNGINSAIL